MGNFVNIVDTNMNELQISKYQQNICAQMKTTKTREHTKNKTLKHFFKICNCFLFILIELK